MPEESIKVTAEKSSSVTAGFAAWMCSSIFSRRMPAQWWSISPESLAVSVFRFVAIAPVSWLCSPWLKFRAPGLCPAGSSRPFSGGQKVSFAKWQKKKHTVYETIINGMLRIFCQSAPHRLGKEHGAHLGRQVQAAADEHAALAGAQRVLHGKRHVLPHGNLPAHLPCRRGQLPGR